MLFRTALRLLVVGAVSAATEQEDAAAAWSQKQADRKQDAVTAVERFLWLFQSEEKDGGEDGDASNNMRVKWDGRFLTPLKTEEPMTNQGKLMKQDSSGKLRRTLEDGALPLDADEGTLDLEDEVSIVEEPMLSEEETVAKKSGEGKRKARGRFKRRRRTAKSGKGKSCKAAKSLKSSGIGSAVEVIRKNAKGSKSSVEEEILCFRGSYQNVTDACNMYNADCCQGERACFWDEEEPPTICQGSCNGDEACDRVAPSSYIGENSCVGPRACRGINFFTNVCEPVVVGQNSCRGSQACAGVCLYVEDCTVEIGDSSCVGTFSCGFISERSMFTESVVIGSYACIPTDPTDDQQCVFVGRNSNANVHIHDYACSGRRPCRAIGEFSVNASLIEIREGACQGQQACAYSGRNNVDGSVVFEEDACYGYRSCIFAGSLAARNILIEEEACSDAFSCFQVGVRGPGDVTVEKESCEGTRSCSQIGQNAIGDVFIGKEACTPQRACTEFGFFADSVYIGDKACNMEAFQCSVYANRTCNTQSFIPKNGQSCFD